MPREVPTEGNAHVVLAYKKGTGLRAEFTGELCREDAEKLLQIVIDMMKNSKGEAP